MMYRLYGRCMLYGLYGLYGCMGCIALQFRETVCVCCIARYTAILLYEVLYEFHDEFIFCTDTVSPGMADLSGHTACPGRV